MPDQNLPAPLQVPRLSLGEKFKTRIPSLGHLRERLRRDPRYLAYDLLPLLGIKARDRFSEALALTLPKTKNFSPRPEAKALCAALKSEGLSPFLPPLDPKILEDLQTYFTTITCHDPYRPHLGRFEWDKPPSSEVNIGYFTWQEIIEAPHMMALINDPLILETAELFFGCKPVIDNIGCTWSYPERQTAKGGQRFHRDYDCTRCFKAFYYLSDVDQGSGPHVFVKGSQASDLLETGKAQTDEMIESVFGTASITPIEAKAGSWFLEDVYGFHKGLVPQTRPRLLLGIEYNLYPSPLSPIKPLLAHDPVYDPYINRLFMKAKIP